MTFKMKFLFSVTVLIISCSSLFAQSKWQPGSFTDNKGNRQAGLINAYPSGKGPVKDEAFIEFRADEKMEPVKLTASELRSFTAGRDSFVLAHPPGNGSWGGKELDFVNVVVDGEIKLYTGKGGGGGGFRVKPGLSGGVGLGGGGYSGVGGGVGISLGSGGGGKNKTTYYYGANTAEMQELTPAAFNDIMCDIMGDEPEVVAQIKQNKFNLTNIDKLVAYFNKVREAHGQ